MIPYPLLLIIHLFAALVFVGAVFFEVLILEGVRKHVAARVMHQIELGVARRARRIMPWVLLALYTSGSGMAWHYRAVLAQPLDSRFGLLLTLKIALALSVFSHFMVAMTTGGSGERITRRFRRIHISVFCHMLAIVLLAKGMFYFGS